MKYFVLGVEGESFQATLNRLARSIDNIPKSNWTGLVGQCPFLPSAFAFYSRKNSCGHDLPNQHGALVLLS